MLVAALPFAALAGPVVVYDNTTHYQGLCDPIGKSSRLGVEAGDRVSLGGSARYVTNISLAVFAARALTTDATVRLYDVDSSDGVGTLLWDSGALSEAVATGENLLSVSVPHVLVEDQLIWTVAFADSSGDVGMASYGPATVGVDYDQIWGRDGYAGGGWLSYWYGGNPWAGLSAAISADMSPGQFVPLPSATAMACVGIAGLTLRRRRGHG